MTRMTIARSRTLLLYLIFVHSLMLGILLSLLGLSLWSLVAMVIFIVSFIYCAKQHQWLKAKRSLVSVEHLADGQWTLHYLDAMPKTGLILASSFVTPQLVMLYFKGDRFWQRDAVTIVADAVDAELFRQLRVHLKAPKTFQQ